MSKTTLAAELYFTLPECAIDYRLFVVYGLPNAVADIELNRVSGTKI